MVHHLDTAGLSLVTSGDESPFVRYRGLLRSYHRWIDGGGGDGAFVELVRALDDAVAVVDGHGFRRTALARFEGLDAAAGARVWVKDETGNVSGSHKGRHLFGVMLLLRVVEELGEGPANAPLAIASCGNAALAAAVVAAAAGRALEVFIPADADPAVVERLGLLGAQLTVCRREGSTSGDPCYHRFTAAVAAGAIPFGCQGRDNGLTIDGGQTLAWEIAEALADRGVNARRLVVQVGGGALASSCIAGFGDAVTLGVLPSMPVVDTVQTTGAAPLARAFRLLEAGVPLPEAARHRSRYMWPWETIPASVARGILDDETYDWLAVVRGMAATGGSALVVDEETLIEANRLARRATGINVDATGSAGLAGLLVQARSGVVAAEDDVVVVFSGVAR